MGPGNRSNPISAALGVGAFKSQGWDLLITEPVPECGKLLGCSGLPNFLQIYKVWGHDCHKTQQMHQVWNHGCYQTFSICKIWGHGCHQTPSPQTLPPFKNNIEYWPKVYYENKFPGGSAGREAPGSRFRPGPWPEPITRTNIRRRVREPPRARGAHFSWFRPLTPWHSRNKPARHPGHRISPNHLMFCVWFHTGPQPYRFIWFSTLASIFLRSRCPRSPWYAYINLSVFARQLRTIFWILVAGERTS